MKKKKILILGTGWSQLDLAQEAKKLGLEIHSVGASKSGPVIELSDYFTQIDIKDIEKLSCYVKENEIDFLFSAGLELAIPVITKVSEALNLRNFFSNDTIEKLDDKYTWRKQLGSMEGNLEHSLVENLVDLDEWNNFPAIMKPVDGTGQRGVYKINNKDEMLKFYDKSMSYSQKKQLIIEKFAEGDEISVNSFMLDGKLIFFLISDRISYAEFPGGIIKKHVIPSQFVSLGQVDEIKELVIEVNRKMDITDGHVYFQLKVTKDKVNLIEFTPRYDGCHMWKLIKEATDINLMEMSLKWLMDETLPNPISYELKNGVFVTEFISDKPGTIVNRGNYQLPEDCLQIHWYYEDGEKVKKVTGHLEKMGYTISQYPLGTKIDS